MWGQVRICQSLVEIYSGQAALWVYRGQVSQVQACLNFAVVIGQGIVVEIPAFVFAVGRVLAWKIAGRFAIVAGLAKVFLVVVLVAVCFVYQFVAVLIPLAAARFAVVVLQLRSFF